MMSMWNREANLNKEINKNKQDVNLINPANEGSGETMLFPKSTKNLKWKINRSGILPVELSEKQFGI